MPVPLLLIVSPLLFGGGCRRGSGRHQMARDFHSEVEIHSNTHDLEFARARADVLTCLGVELESLYANPGTRQSAAEVTPAARCESSIARFRYYVRPMVYTNAWGLPPFHRCSESDLGGLLERNAGQSAMCRSANEYIGVLEQRLHGMGSLLISTPSICGLGDLREFDAHESATRSQLAELDRFVVRHHLEVERCLRTDDMHLWCGDLRMVLTVGRLGNISDIEMRPTNLRISDSCLRDIFMGYRAQGTSAVRYEVDYLLRLRDSRNPLTSATNSRTNKTAACG